MQIIAAVLQEVLLHRLVAGTDDPVLRDTTGLVDILLMASVILGRAGGEDFRHQIRSAVDAVLFDLVRITDNHKVRDEVICLGEKNLFTITKGFTATAFEMGAEQVEDIAADPVVIG